MKLYLSADIEGTAGTIHWNEGCADQSEYGYFREQMTKEVSAACEGAIAAGADEILVKDAHYTARNIIPSMLPESVSLFRGWDETPEMMMAGLDESFDGVICTGYHSAAGTDKSPLSHTMNPKAQTVLCNGSILSEFDINAMTAAYYGVPVFFVSGDQGLCEAVKAVNPHIKCVATNEGRGGGAICIHPSAAVTRIRQTVAQALQSKKELCLYPLPEKFRIDICYKEHTLAAKAASFPGVVRKDAMTVTYQATDYMDVLKMFLWLL